MGPVTLLLGAIVEVHSTIWYSGAALVPPTDLRPHFNKQLIKHTQSKTSSTEVQDQIKLRRHNGVLFI